MIIKNTSGKDVEITIKGIVYKVEANDETEVSSEVATEWKATHEFLQVSGSDAVVETVKETPVVEEEKEEVPEVLVEEVKEEVIEKPKKKIIKKFKK